MRGVLHRNHIVILPRCIIASLRGHPKLTHPPKVVCDKGTMNNSINGCIFCVHDSNSCTDLSMDPIDLDMSVHLAHSKNGDGHLRKVRFVTQRYNCTMVLSFCVFFISVQHDWIGMVGKIQDHIHALNFNYRVTLRAKHVDYFNAIGEIEDAHTVKVQLMFLVVGCEMCVWLGRFKTSVFRE